MIFIKMVKIWWMDIKNLNLTYSAVWLFESNHEDNKSCSRDKEDLHESVIE